MALNPENKTRQPDRAAYSTEVDKINRNEWENLLERFDDASLYQTWAYGRVRWKEENLSHFLLKQEDEIIAAAQIRIFKIPFTSLGIAYIPHGPLWHLRGMAPNPDIFRFMIRELKREYVLKQGLALRVKPNEIDMPAGKLKTILLEEGYSQNKTVAPYRTLLMDITPSTEELLKDMKKKWRKTLKRSQNNGLTILENSSKELYGKFTALYREMQARKQFAEFVDIEEFEVIQQELAPHHKLEILVCEHDNMPVAALVWSAIGNTGITIFSATGNEGLHLLGPYVLRWKMVEKLKLKGCRFLDQGGINPEDNPGTYRFKAGFGGKDVSHIGQFDAVENPLTAFILRIGDIILSGYRQLKRKTAAYSANLFRN